MARGQRGLRIRNETTTHLRHVLPLQNLQAGGRPGTGLHASECVIAHLPHAQRCCHHWGCDGDQDSRSHGLLEQINTKLWPQ